MKTFRTIVLFNFLLLACAACMAWAAGGSQTSAPPLDFKVANSSPLCGAGTGTGRLPAPASDTVPSPIALVTICGACSLGCANEVAGGGCLGIGNQVGTCVNTGGKCEGGTALCRCSVP